MKWFFVQFGNKLNSFNKLHSLRSCNFVNSFNLFPNCTQNRLIILYYYYYYYYYYHFDMNDNMNDVIMLLDTPKCVRRTRSNVSGKKYRRWHVDVSAEHTWCVGKVTDTPWCVERTHQKRSTHFPLWTHRCVRWTHMVCWQGHRHTMVCWVDTSKKINTLPTLDTHRCVRRTHLACWLRYDLWTRFSVSGEHTYVCECGAIVMQSARRKERGRPWEDIRLWFAHIFAVSRQPVSNTKSGLWS